nr:uncharacterized protein LOC129270111 [Lytechinus pictus]
MADGARAMSSVKMNLDTSDHFTPGTRKYATQSLGWTSGRCNHSKFLLCALTMGQIVVLMLFSVWTIKACYIRSHRIYVVTTVDSSPLSHKNQLFKNASHLTNMDDRHHLHGNHSNVTDQLVRDTRFAPFQRNVMNNGSARKSDTDRNIRIIGTTNIKLLNFTLNWFESLSRIHIKYDVTFIAEDQRTYETLTMMKQNSKKFERTSFVAGRRSQGARIAGLSSSDCDVLLDYLEAGVDVVHIAPDTVWLKDPIPLLWQKYDKCDLWITFGAIRTQSLSLAYMKANPNVIAYVKALKEQMINLQSEVLTTTMALKLGFIAFKCNVGLCYLGENHFPSEVNVFEEEGTWYNAHREGIYVIRTGAIVDTAQKQYSLQKINFWYLDS